MNRNDKHWSTVQSMYSERVRLDIVLTYYPKNGTKRADSKALAKELWDKYMDEHSNGLVVSELPRFLLPKKDGQLIELNDSKVLDPNKWDSVDLDVRYEWKLQIERNDIAKKGNANDPVLKKRFKDLKRRMITFAYKLESWTYESYIGQIPKGNPNDLGNVRHYRLPSLEAIPMDFPKDRLKVEFWHRLLVLWDGPENKKADNVRAFLTHHHTHGNNPERFRDLVAETVKIFRDKVTELDSVIALPPTIVRRENQIRNKKERDQFGSLADKMESWLSNADKLLSVRLEAVEDFTKLLREDIPGFSVSTFPAHITIGTAETYPEIYPGFEIQRVGLVEGLKEHNIEQHVQAICEQLPIKFREISKNWRYLSLNPPSGCQHEFDLPNPRHYLLDGTQITSEKSNHPFETLGRAASSLFTQFKADLNGAWLSPMNLRKKKVVEYLDHHYQKGGNPTAFLDFMESAIYSTSTDGKKTWYNYKPELQRELVKWLEKKVGTIDEGPNDGNQITVSPKRPDLKIVALWLALRWAATKDKKADLITDTYAGEIAKELGYDSPSSGKRLRSHFHTYASEAGRTGKGKRVFDVVKRYDFVIDKLEMQPKTLALAIAERTKVRNRANESAE